MSLKIIDNFLPIENFKEIQKIFLSENINWHFRPSINSKADKNLFQFDHCFFDNMMIYSDFFSLLQPIFKKLNCKSLIRAKLNLTTQTTKSIFHGYHIDYENNKTAIMYFNTTNGKTYFENLDPVDCIENRLVSFNSNIKHSSSSCTDRLRRVVLNINYYEY